MLKRISRRVLNAAFNGGLTLLAWMTRRPSLQAWAQRLLVLSGRLTNRMFGVRAQSTASAIGHEWERTFPSRKIVRITEVVGDTAYGEIHVGCPLRGSGDVHACWRLMAYDRTIADRAGASFVVLASQAEPGRSHCRVALRAHGLPLDDLKPAHQRSPVAVLSPKK